MIESRTMRWVGDVEFMGKRSAYKVLVQKPTGNRPLGRFMCKWDSIKMNVKETEWEDVDWIHKAQDRFVM
jgi:hypothetical protein